jgi:two-component system, chemotaxis family, response regulator Rcp1
MRSPHILLVEDNPSDVRLTREAMKEARTQPDLEVVTDGEEVLEYLHRRGRFEGARRPDIILLDLNLPRRSGKEVLAEIKATPELRSIPVVVLSNSRDEDDIRGSYDLHANCYIGKPLDLDDFIEVIRRIDEFWLHIVNLPARSAPAA